MKFQSLLLLPVLLASAAAPAWAEGSAEAGQTKSAPCVACHGIDGNSANPEWPSIASQPASYIVKQLQAFKSEARQNPLMTPQAKPLSDQDMQDLAAYYAKQQRRGGEADPNKLALGQRLYRGGDKARGVPACIACHGPNGTGNPAAVYAAIGGQHATYLAAQLKAYKAGTRQTDQNQMMRNVAAAMSDEQIDAVSSYVQGLR
jgi:cytochrome c553